MTLTELRTLTRKLSGIRMAGVWQDDDIDRAINEVYLELCAADNWPFLATEATATVAAGASRATFSPAMRMVLSVVDPTSRVRPRLREVSVDELETVPDRGPAGPPRAYARTSATELWVSPTPTRTTALELRGFKQPQALTGSESPAFDAEFHPALAYAAAGKLLMYEGDDSGRSQGYAEEVTGYLLRMQRRYRTTADTGVVQMGGRAVPRGRWSL